ncbi:MAG: ROK family protein [Beutenbergiaceae bacterium]
MRAAQMVVGVDIGGTKTAAAAVDRSGKVHRRLSAPTPALLGADAIIADVSALVTAVVGKRPLAAVGVGAAGVVNSEGTIIAGNDTFTDWVGTPLRTRLADELGVPVQVNNDVDTHLSGEAWVGSAQGIANTLLVAIGTGVGAAMLVEGQLVRGAHHVAGEMGHMPSTSAQGLRCPCGISGHLEAIAAGPAIHRSYLAAGGDPTCQDAREVAHRCQEGEPAAIAVIDNAAHAMGIALAQIVTMLDPELIVLGGSVARMGTRWWARVESDLRAQLIDTIRPVRLTPSQLGADAPLLGAAVNAWQMLEGRSPHRTR